MDAVVSRTTGIAGRRRTAVFAVVLGSQVNIATHYYLSVTSESAGNLCGDKFSANSPIRC